MKYLVTICILLITVSAYAGQLSDLRRATPAVNIIDEQKEMFSIFAFCEQSQRVFFHNVTDIQADGDGVWFVHNGKRKYISGNFYIEPAIGGK